MALREVHPFGPQSRWSVLLRQREFLSEELSRGRLCLQRLERDMAGRYLPFRGGWQDAGASSALDDKLAENAKDDAMVTFLCCWLQELEERVGVVNREIDSANQQCTMASPEFEESMFALLRAAG